MLTDSLYSLVSRYHRHMDELILLHQEALLLQQTDLAARFLALFRAMISAHIDAENAWLLPRLDALAEARWPALLYRKEHDKILDMLGNVDARMRVLEGKTAQDYRRAVLALLDYERAFKNVIEHHEEREEVAMLRELDQHVDGAEVQQLVVTLEQAWRPLLQTQEAMLPALVSELHTFG
ncbi:MAG: hypothetical protein R3F47_18685 [Gammaproteobacteria bacterium]